MNVSWLEKTAKDKVLDLSKFKAFENDKLKDKSI